MVLFVVGLGCAVGVGVAGGESGGRGTAAVALAAIDGRAAASSERAVRAARRISGSDRRRALAASAEAVGLRRGAR